MQTQGGFIKMSPTEFSGWLGRQKVSRVVQRVQLHHTYEPSYRHFNATNHFARQQSMKEYHLSRGYDDIAQHFTIFPDGEVMTGRPLGKIPAGIKGGNQGAVCIEVFGCFDAGRDAMSTAQRDAVVTVTAALLLHFGLNPRTAVTYHAWWTADGRQLGDYDKYHSCKTCPGTAFFGGNTRAAYNNNLLPLLQAAVKGEPELTETQVRAVVRDEFEKLMQDRGQANEHDWAKAGMIELAAMGVTDGQRPQAFMTREEAWTMAHRIIKRVISEQ